MQICSQFLFFYENILVTLKNVFKKMVLNKKKSTFAL